jgi:uncharacterized protein YyaL (SSP411 family)
MAQVTEVDESRKQMKRFIAVAVLFGSLNIVACNAQEPATSKAQHQAETTGSANAHEQGPANHLAGETSPYLLAHAHNPVDWYPWDEEALEKAKKENKPIFLSIGYSSCHWCHVMERESFVDKEIAAFLNEHFICIKVDREERPDIDHVYMTSLYMYNQLAGNGGGGGWPLSMFLTPEGLPFFGGTYFPARDGDRGGSSGFLSIIRNIENIWQAKPDQIRADAKVVTEYAQRELSGGDANTQVPLSADWINLALRELPKSFDALYGGFTILTSPERPKFPEPARLFFLIDVLQQDPNNAEAMKMLTVTLDRMAMGGIWDHVGGGFHRYSVDRYWRIPHFEKMLYDNGQLATVYAEAYKLTGRADYRRVAEKICGFVLSELLAEEGAFYSALDADSEGEEGKFYVWTRAEIQNVLGEEYTTFANAYGIQAAPNFEGEFYAPQYAKPFPEMARLLNVEPDAMEAALVPLRAKLLAERAKRERPLTDTKILTSWNGLMIRGLADAGRILDRPDFLEAARNAASFILDSMTSDEQRLFRTYAGGKAKLNAYLNDYAFFINGLLALHQATDEPHWLEEAKKLQAIQDQFYWDDAAGGYFFTSSDHEALLARAKDISDGAEPSGISVSAENLAWLARLSEGEQQMAYRDRAQKTLSSLSAVLQRSPTIAPRILIPLRAVTN